MLRVFVSTNALSLTRQGPVSILLLFCSLLIANSAMGQSTMLEEIIVTAQKRSENQSDIGLSITSFTEEQINLLNISSGEDVAHYTPGFTIAKVGGVDVPVLTIRGVGFIDTQPNSSSTVGVYSDGIQLPYPIMTSFQHFDLMRVEVLKGPQGDLYGRNNTGGAVNFISHPPSNVADAELSLGYANYKTIRTAGHFNTPLSDRLQTRTSFLREVRGEGWQVNEDNGDKAGEFTRLGVRTQVGFEPSTSLSISLKAYSNKELGGPQVPQSTAITPSSNAAAAFLYGHGLFPVDSLNSFVVTDQGDPKAARWGFAPRGKTTMSGASAKLDWGFNNVTLVYNAGFDKFARSLNLDWDGTERSSLDTSAETSIKSFSQELRLESDRNANVFWVAGLFQSRDKVEDATSYDGTGSPTLGFTFGSKGIQKTDSIAAFGHTEWRLQDGLHLTVGGRLTTEKRKVSNCTTDTGDGTIAAFFKSLESGGYYTITNPEAAVPGACIHLEGDGTGSPPLVRIPGLHRDSIRTERVSGKIGLKFTTKNNWLVYASISNSFKSGGYNMITALTVEQFTPYSEEVLTAYEMGLKGTLLNDTMKFSGTLFGYDYTDKQESSYIPDSLGIFPTLVGITNIPRSRIIGSELDVRWQASDQITVLANTSYIDTEIKSYQTAYDAYNGSLFQGTGDASGLSLQNTPEFSFTVTGIYEVPITNDLQLRSSISLAFQDEMTSQIVPIPVFAVDAYKLLDLNVTLEHKDLGWSAAFWMKNALDEAYFLSNSLSQDNVVRFTGMPRTFGVALKAVF